MEDIYRKRKGQAGKPHRHDYFTIIFIRKAKGRHVIDFQEYPLKDQSVFFISPGQVHQVKEKDKPSGDVITFTREFLVDNHIRESFIGDINLFRDYGESPPLSLDKKLFGELNNYINKMRHLLKSGKALRYEALGAYLKLFLIACHDACDIADHLRNGEEQKSISLLRNFKTLVDVHFPEQHKVGHYASLLSISTNHLNKTVKKYTGHTAKDYIQNRITTEARRLLLYTDQSAKEISYQLGFHDPSYFSNFFRKGTGQSISDFRKKNA